MDQFVRQYLSALNVSGPRPWNRPLDQNRDRLGLVTTTEASAPVRAHLLAVLNRARGLVAGQPLPDAANNQTEHAALDIVTGHIRRVWMTVTRQDSTEGELLKIMRLMYVTVLDVETGGSAEGQALDLLALAVVAHQNQATPAWSRILQIVADLSQRRSGTDPAALRAVLQPTIPLKTAPSYQDDVEKLKKHSKTTLDYLSHNSRIVLGGTTIRAERGVVAALHSASEEESVVVVGVPGAGKSAALHDYAQSVVNEVAM